MRGLAPLAAVLACAPGAFAADEPAEPFGWLDYRYVVKVLNSASFYGPGDSTLNPGNAVLQLPAVNLDTQARPDLNASAGPVAFYIKPRLALSWQAWDEGPRDGEETTDTDSYVNEWQLRLSIADRVFVSYGRENLQWGPSYLFSPSNPFVQDNGQNNPKREVAGMDYGKLQWIPVRNWSVSLIANVGEGRAGIERNIDNRYDGFVDLANREAQAQIDYIDRQYEQGVAQIDQLRQAVPGNGPLAQRLNRRADELLAFAAQQRDAAVAEVDRTVNDILDEAALQRDAYNREFRNQYALKTDWQTTEKYATLVASYQESAEREDPKRTRLGGYAGWTASDALLLYTEASASLRGGELYPTEDPNSPFGMRLARTREVSDDFKAGAVAGASYTFLGGQTIIGEYLHNGSGYNGSQASDYYDLREQAADGLGAEEPVNTLSLVTLGLAADPGMRFIRQNYLLLQYQHFQIVGELGFVMRATYGLDDNSAQLIPIMQYSLGDHTQLFAILNQNVGPQNTEFTSLYTHAYQIGLELSF